ncbi:MAG: hypothetical protein M3063_04130 [Actinomycetota bacterium]|nr:hypothetical protein [Actinomycetota bacterium]
MRSTNIEDSEGDGRDPPTPERPPGAGGPDTGDVVGDLPALAPCRTVRSVAEQDAHVAGLQRLIGGS